MSSSTPTLTAFDPRHIPFQLELIQDIRRNLDYSDGAWELLASGAIGSSKTMVGAHLAVTHCMMYPGANFVVGRQTMPSLRRTLLRKIEEHIGDDIPGVVFNRSTGIFYFPNGSMITPVSWKDGHFKKVRSEEFTAGIIEELTENEDLDAYDEILARIGRQRHVEEKFLLCLTNPDEPTHPAYDYWIGNPQPLRKVYYSKTQDNPFLPPSYFKKLLQKYDSRMARRLLFGEWLSIASEVIYYAYSREHHYRDHRYEVSPRHWVGIAYDFNIALGKPLSASIFQCIDGTYHFFEEVVIEGARTLDSLEEMQSRGIFDLPVPHFRIFGDASGKHRDTRSKTSDYDIIDDYLRHLEVRGPDGRRRRIEYSIDVPTSNPPIRTRHNTVNGVLQNAIGERRMAVYAPCEMIDKGLRLTKLREGAGYLEDDTKDYQHVTTSLGYAICYLEDELDTSDPFTQIR